MYSIVSGQGETSTQVLLEEWGAVFLDVLNEFLVNFGLELCTLSRDLLLGSLIKEASSSGLLLSLSEGFVDDAINLDSGGADLGGGGDSVNLIDASEWDSIDLVWSTDEKQTGLELLKEYNSLATESSGGEDENATSLNTFSKFWGSGFLSADLSFLVFGRVPVGYLFFDH